MTNLWRALAVALCFLAYANTSLAHGRRFEIEEATIDEIQDAIRERKISTTDVVRMYLARIQAYNGTCVNEPNGILGPVTMIPNAGKVNALMTLNLRPKNRIAWGLSAGPG